eukprot:TRINITY_DN1504_c0_g1_i1.p1 TRINITY_DN1504_c0_g1~~TRINITY_DN1504_c0_g1_i1.p1  ORF type:complete len:141 (+),score=31.86 TRINITY_DN1504_c0_g1_i1:236-658(+)
MLAAEKSAKLSAEAKVDKIQQDHSQKMKELELALVDSRRDLLKQQEGMAAKKVDTSKGQSEDVTEADTASIQADLKKSQDELRLKTVIVAEMEATSKRLKGELSATKEKFSALKEKTRSSRRSWMTQRSMSGGANRIQKR